MSTEVYFESRAPRVYGCTISFLAIAFITAVLRFLARRLSAAAYWWDEWTILVALVRFEIETFLPPSPSERLQTLIYRYKLLNSGLSICDWLQIRHRGLGRHSVPCGGPVSDQDLTTYYKVRCAPRY